LGEHGCDGVERVTGKNECSGCLGEVLVVAV
jgi:hypothetical protein